MTGEELKFWLAIDASPADKLPLLVFCDWLDERGQSGWAETIRRAVADGRRPGRFPDGRAWWVTTTRYPVAWRKVRGQPYARIREQSSWLSSHHWRYLRRGAVDVMEFAYPFSTDLTVWQYSSVSASWAELCRVEDVMRKGLINPATGRHAFLGSTNSKWRNEARRVIHLALAALPPEATDKERRKAVSAAYPFGVRGHHPYKMWCAEVRVAMDKKVPAVNPKVRVIDGDHIECGWCHGHGCVACAAERMKMELAGTNLCTNQ